MISGWFQLFAENQILYMSLPLYVVPERFCVVVYAPQLLMLVCS